MKKIVFCNIPMKEKCDKSVFSSDDRSLPVSDSPVIFPVSAFLKCTLKSDDEIKVVLLAKKDKKENYKINENLFIEEINDANRDIGAEISFISIESDFEENKSVHESLLMNIIDKLEPNAHILCDITYGPKDLPIVVFTALNYAERFLNCEIDNIVYGQANFVDGKPINTKICDMSSLFYLNSIVSTIKSGSPENAKQMLESLLS